MDSLSQLLSVPKSQPASFHSSREHNTSGDSLIKSHIAMARPIPDLKTLSKTDKPFPMEEKSIVDRTIDISRKKSSSNLIIVKPGLQAAPTTTPTEPIEKQPPESQPPKPIEHFKPEETSSYVEKPSFLPLKPVSHSPKISPSSIPNPSPSVTTNKPVEPGYPNYGGYLYSIPGYSAFQPVAYQGLSSQNIPTNKPPQPIPSEATNKSEFVLFPPKVIKETKENNDLTEVNPPVPVKPTETTKPQTDFEDQFTTEVVTALTETEAPSNEAKLNITSLAQGSGATVTISNTVQDIKKKQTERYSLKTSIPISKIDMKCVNTPTDTFENNLRKKSVVPFNPAFQITNDNVANTKVEIQSNVVVKNAATTEAETKPAETIHTTPPSVTTNNNITTLINAAEAISTSESQQYFWKTESKSDNPNDNKEALITKPIATRPLFNPMNTEISFSKPSEVLPEQKNQIVFINKNPSNPKMLLTISQQQASPQVLLQRNNYDPKNMQAPSRLSSLNKKSKDEQEMNNSSKVVALKRLHQENCDENDFENLITENQIYGNKIVVKEKTQGTSQEQDLKKNSNKLISEKVNQTHDTKNLVLQPNFLYLSNVQFPANLMMIKNTTKITQNTIENNKNNMKNEPNENNTTNQSNDSNNDLNSNVLSKGIKSNKEVHVLKPNNSLIQTMSHKSNNKTTDIIFQTNQKVIMNSQILYQVPTMIVDTDGMTNNIQKLNNSTFINRDYSKFLTQNKKELPKSLDNTKSNDKLYIACPYQMDSKLQPKIVITNIRPKIAAKVEEVSTLDFYEKRKRLRRLKYLTNRDPKSDVKKEKTDAASNVITPDKVTAEIYKEFTKTRATMNAETSDSDSDYGEEELNEYKTILETYVADHVQDNGDQRDFLISFRLATHEDYKEKILERQERSLRSDAVASAYIAANRIDRLSGGQTVDTSVPGDTTPSVPVDCCPAKVKWSARLDGATKKKKTFLSQLELRHVSTRYKADYERAWQQIVKERRRRDGIPERFKCNETINNKISFDTKDQLQILTEIKKYVNENNNLIKRRLDIHETSETTGETIHTLAEKNFSELSKLSKMADRSVKLFSGKDMRKRDLNPGFDSENMPKLHQQPYHKNPSIKIPNISKTISLKTAQEPSFVNTTPATSMDEPQNSAAGTKDDRSFEQTPVRDNLGHATTFDGKDYSWPGIETVLKSYQHFENARKREIAELQQRNTQLRVECANANRTAARETELARTLIAERQILANGEYNVRLSIQRLMNSVDIITKYC